MDLSPTSGHSQRVCREGDPALGSLRFRPLRVNNNNLSTHAARYGLTRVSVMGSGPRFSARDHINLTSQECRESRKSCRFAIQKGYADLQRISFRLDLLAGNLAVLRNCSEGHPATRPTRTGVGPRSFFENWNSTGHGLETSLRFRFRKNRECCKSTRAKQLIPKCWLLSLESS